MSYIITALMSLIVGVVAGLFIAALIGMAYTQKEEEQSPQSPIYGYDEQDYIRCPRCQYPLDEVDAGEYANHFNYCPECGKKIDWNN